MVATRLVPKITKNAHHDGEVGANQIPLADDQLKSLLDSGKPITVWEVAVKFGKDYVKQVSAILDELTARGILARFRVGFVNYYAPPNVALTGDEPTLRTVISDSVKSLFLILGFVCWFGEY